MIDHIRGHACDFDGDATRRFESPWELAPKLAPTEVKAISSPSISLSQGGSAIDHRRGQACEFDGGTTCRFEPP